MHPTSSAGQNRTGTAGENGVSQNDVEMLALFEQLAAESDRERAEHGTRPDR